MHTGGIGDFLLACPAIAQLAQDGPVTLLGRRERLALAVAGGIAAAAHDLDSVDFASVFSEPSERFRAFVSGFDRALVWMRDEDERIARAFRDAGPTEVRCFPGLPPEHWARHASEYYADCAGVTPPSEFRLTVPPAESGYDVVIHPGSGGQRKNWPRPHFEDLARRLAAQGRRIAWCAGPAEEDWPPPSVGVQLPPMSLTGLAGVLSRTAFYMGNDSGITHLAAAAGCPTLALFGPTDPGVWAPRGPHVRVLRGIPWPSPEEVAAAIATWPFSG